GVHVQRTPLESRSVDTVGNEVLGKQRRLRHQQNSVALGKKRPRLISDGARQRIRSLRFVVRTPQAAAKLVHNGGRQRRYQRDAVHVRIARNLAAIPAGPLGNAGGSSRYTTVVFPGAGERQLVIIVEAVVEANVVLVPV